MVKPTKGTIGTIGRAVGRVIGKIFMSLGTSGLRFWDLGPWVFRLCVWVGGGGGVHAVGRVGVRSFVEVPLSLDTVDSA